MMTWPLSIALFCAFRWNLLLTVESMLVGSLLGYLLARMMNSYIKAFHALGTVVNRCFCYLPSYVLLIVFPNIFPQKIMLLGWPLRFSPMSIAMIALSIPVIGLSSRLWAKTGTKKMKYQHYIFYRQYFIVILMASVTSSVIGVPEILATANTYVASVARQSAFFPVYGFVCGCFMTTAILIRVFFRLCVERVSHK
ncbi:MAG: hypothetical protein CENE_01205 [Candidatus Celerinatantimonas neptuna]|nr:MAG: hypothetical protein CENE_01205 [Candidatus Celerinatantimonas neptuna]